MLGSREDAEDVVQETFAAAYGAMVADERPINVKPWLYRIARNRSLNHMRRQSAIGVDDFDAPHRRQRPTTADTVHKREEFRQLIADVRELPETQRTALLLREIDALSYDQIAEAMETTVPSVKSLLVRARVSLAEAAEARKLTCEEVREELGEVAEGLTRLLPPVRRHLRDCERCTGFRKSLRETNRALALMLPVGPLLLLKKLMLAQLGTTASAGGAAAARRGDGAAARPAGAGGALSAGMSAVASKAAATVAAAAIVTAGAVEVDQVRHARPSARTPATFAAAAPARPPQAARDQAAPRSRPLATRVKQAPQAAPPAAPQAEEPTRPPTRRDRARRGAGRDDDGAAGADPGRADGPRRRPPPPAPTPPVQVAPEEQVDVVTAPAELDRRRRPARPRPTSEAPTLTEQPPRPTTRTADRRR